MRAPPTSRWTRLSYHPIQQSLLRAPRRFCVVPSGRRSGKTEIGKRRLCIAAMLCPLGSGKFVAAAPTRDQAKRIYWADFKRLIPEKVTHEVSETDLEIRLTNGSRLCVVGMDRPERIEGEPLDGILLDEYANMKEQTWSDHVRPALFTLGRPPGWAWFIGVPEGRNHYYRMFRRARRDDSGFWGAYHWFSSDILPEQELREARRDLDPRTYRQEYEGSFEAHSGLAYYAFGPNNVRRGLRQNQYRKDLPIEVCWDFNVKPGIVIVAQELDGRGMVSMPGAPLDSTVTAVIWEKFIDSNTNTPMMCREFLEEWAFHPGPVHLHGDATGGAKSTLSEQGSNWDIITNHLAPVYGPRLSSWVPRENPRQRVRVNAMNSRAQAADGTVGFLVDPEHAPQTINDFEAVEVVEGTAGELKKEPGSPLTHLSDAIGYYVASQHPIYSTELLDMEIHT